MIWGAMILNNERRQKLCPLIWVFFLATSLWGCAALNKIVEKPAISFEGIRLRNASMLGSTLDFKFIVKNPNPLRLHTGKISYDLKVNGRHLARGRLDQGVTLPAGGTASLNVPVIVRYLDVYESMAEMVRAQQTAYDLNGTVRIGPLQVPIRASGIFNLPQLPAISLEAIHIRHVSLSGANLNCLLKIDNPNAFGLTLKNFKYNLQLGELDIARASAQPAGPVPQKGASTIEMVVDVSFARLGRSAYDLLMGTDSKYRIDGRMLFDSPAGGIEAVPFTTIGKTPLR